MHRRPFSEAVYEVRLQPVRFRSNCRVSLDVYGGFGKTSRATAREGFRPKSRQGLEAICLRPRRLVWGNQDRQRGVYGGKAEGSSRLPGFRWAFFKRGVIENLPLPSVPFALDLSSSKITDKDLKELAVLENLQALILWATPVSDTGLKELRGLKSLQYLDLGSTLVTAVASKNWPN
jgi:hypothetical protein